MTKREEHLPLSTPMFAVLATLGERSMHGLGIIEAFDRSTGQYGTLLPGSLYNTIARMLKQGLLEEASAPDTETDGRKRYYRATKLGRAVAAAESARLRGLLALAEDEGLATG